MKSKALLLAVLMAGLAGPALAADPPLTPIDYDDDLIVPQSAFDWNGLYAGVAGGFWSGNSNYVYFGGLIGGNYVMDTFLLGIEASGKVYSDGDFGGDVLGRFGVVLDTFVLSAHGGLGMRDGAPHVFVGVGAEAGLMENVSIAGTLDFVNGSGFNAIRGEASIRYHF